MLARHAQQREQVLDVRVHAAIAQQTDQVQSMPPPALHGFEQQRLLKQGAGLDRAVNPGDVHVNDAAGADIQMAHFAVAHLSLGQSNRRPRGMHQGIGKLGQQPVIVGLAGQSDGVAGAFGAISPAVENGKNNRLRSLGHGESGYTESQWAETARRDGNGNDVER